MSMTPRPAFKLKRWETPVSDAKSLSMVSLEDGARGLRIIVQDLLDPARRRWRFSFARVPAYRNVLEEYRTGEPMPGKMGWTVMVPGSAWLKSLRRGEPLLDVHDPGCEHYAIYTEDDVIDILSPRIPEIAEVPAAAAEEPLPGKSRVLRHPEDREESDRVLGEMKTRQDSRQREC